MIVSGSRILKIWVALIAAVGVTLAAAPATAGVVSDPVVQTTPAPDRARMNRRVFDRIWTEVERGYYDPELHGVDWDAARATYRPRALTAADDRALYRALGEMLALLDDDHANAVSPAVARRQDQLRQRRPVLGLNLRPEPDGDYRIEQVRAGSPADEAGIQPGWLLDDAAWTPESTVVEGIPIALLLQDTEGAPHALTLTPRVMDPIPAFSVDRSRTGVAVLRIEGFETGLGRWLGDQLAALSPEIDVVIDLRRNPGGRMTEADALLSCFLPREQPWATRTSRSGRATVMRTSTPCGRLDGPVTNDVAVLVDAGSRSAAELTPAALQEARRAVVVGEQTGGAVLISQELNLPDGGRLTLSRSDFITRGGVRLEKRGVTPDILATVTLQDRRAGRDPALDAAIAALARPTEQGLSIATEPF